MVEQADCFPWVEEEAQAQAGGSEWSSLLQVLQNYSDLGSSMEIMSMTRTQLFFWGGGGLFLG